MRPIARPALAAVVIDLGPARAALAACGDGVLQAGEVCDASAPNGDVACRGACIAPALAGAWTCAVPSDDARDFVLLARDHLRLGNDLVVIDGHAGVASPLGVLVACTGGAARDCSDDNTCSVDTCDPVAGCQHTPRPDGASCGAGTCHGGFCS